MLERFFRKKENELRTEAILASNWWASKLLDPYVRYYDGSISYAFQKKSIPSKESVAIFRNNLSLAINDAIVNAANMIPFNLTISSSDDSIIKMADLAQIEDFESHFGKGAIMFIDDENIEVFETGRKPFNLRK